VGGSDYYLEKFEHGVRFGEPGDYEAQPEGADQFILDEKEFITIGAGVQSDLNNPVNNQSSEFDNSDNQLMEIIRNKKKPTPRIVVDRTIKGAKNVGDALDDIAELGQPKNHIGEIKPEELGVRQFKKRAGAKERGVPDLSTTDFNVNVNNKDRSGTNNGKGPFKGDDLNELNIVDNKQKVKVNERVGSGQEVNVARKSNNLISGNTVDKSTKKVVGPLDDLVEVSSVDEADIREGNFSKGGKLKDREDSDFEESGPALFPKGIKFKRNIKKIGEEEEVSLGGSVDSQENLVVGTKDATTKGKKFGDRTESLE
jgi:hypothetical protein